ncbi:hypothetical protein PH586_11800 [Pseudomonas sp. SA3-5]|uniref:Uncharacterized protein n=1 Tax=Pseudomonas aestuarii TaxID=3018340 RepID=A0ABT4XFW5_9PSED|nr:hypothetical protein [Pseudomonas aestuarii]MDA7087069.1 hypothetical protein [Pseudomonas aestuarii]
MRENLLPQSGYRAVLLDTFHQGAMSLLAAWLALHGIPDAVYQLGHLRQRPAVCLGRAAQHAAQAEIVRRS